MAGGHEVLRLSAFSLRSWFHCPGPPEWAHGPLLEGQTCKDNASERVQVFPVHRVFSASFLDKMSSVVFTSLLSRPAFSVGKCVSEGGIGGLAAKPTSTHVLFASSCNDSLLLVSSAVRGECGCLVTGVCAVFDGAAFLDGNDALFPPYFVSPRFYSIYYLSRCGGGERAMGLLFGNGGGACVEALAAAASALPPLFLCSLSSSLLPMSVGAPGDVPALVFAGDVLPAYVPGADVPRLAPRPQEVGVGGVLASTFECPWSVLFPPLCDRGLSRAACVGSPPALPPARCGSRLELPPGAAFGVVCPGIMLGGISCF